MPLLLVSNAARAMFSPDYGFKKLILFQYEFSYNREKSNYVRFYLLYHLPNFEQKILRTLGTNM